LGRPLLLDDLLYQPDNSLVRQSYDPQMLHMLNLAGFGMAIWDPSSHQPEQPLLYKIPGLPVFEGNLRNLARKIRTTCALAHVRGVAYRETEVVSQENLHPFLFDGCRLAMAHNGDLADFPEMKYALLEHIRPELAQKIVGTTDSAWIYAVLMSQFADPTADHDTTEIRRAVEKTLRALRRVREQIGIRTSSSVNLFLCDGNDLVATRFSFDFGCYGDKVQPSDIRYLSLWYTFGREYGLHEGEWKMRGGHENADSVIVASEPLTRDISSWLELPEYSLLFVSRTDGAPRVYTAPLDV